MTKAIEDAANALAIRTALGVPTNAELAAVSDVAEAAYVKPADGIPHNDLHTGIRDRLDLADTALQPGALPVGTTVTAAQISDAGAAGRTLLQKATLPEIQSLVSGAGLPLSKFWRGTTSPRARLSSFAAAAALAKTPGNRCVIADVGDSTHCGFDGSYANKRSQSLAAILSTLLNSYGLYANYDSFMGSQNVELSSTTPFAYDLRLTKTGSMTTIQLSTVGRYGYYLAAGLSGSLVFQPAASYDTIEFYYATDVSASNGSVTINNGGASLGDYTCNAASSLTRQAITVAESRNPITITRGATAGNIFPVGVILRNTTRAEICVVNAAWNGSIVSDFSTPGTKGYSHANAYPTLQANLTIFGCQINDWRAGTAVATYKTNTRTAINTAKQTGDVLLYTGMPSDATAAALATQRLYVVAYEELMDEYTSGVGLIDINSFVGSYSAMSGAYYSDTYHGNGDGYRLVGVPIASVVLAAAF